MSVPSTTAIPVLSQRHGAIGLLRPKGVVNQSSIPAIIEAMDQLKLGGRPMLVIDLVDTIVLDGKALEWLLETDDQFGGLGGGVTVTHANELCEEIFRLTGLNQRLSIFHDLATALGSFTK